MRSYTVVGGKWGGESKTRPLLSSKITISTTSTPVGLEVAAARRPRQSRRVAAGFGGLAATPVRVGGLGGNGGVPPSAAQRKFLLLYSGVKTHSVIFIVHLLVKYRFLLYSFANFLEMAASNEHCPDAVDFTENSDEERDNNVGEKRQVLPIFASSPHLPSLCARWVIDSNQPLCSTQHESFRNLFNVVIGKDQIKHEINDLDMEVRETFKHVLKTESVCVTMDDSNTC